MGRTLKRFSVTGLRAKQVAFYDAHRWEAEEMANDEQTELELEAPEPANETTADLELEAPEPANETKAERFKRVVNPRVKVAVKRLRLIRQMFEGANANNYTYTAEQAERLNAVLHAEVKEIYDLMQKRLRGGDEAALDEI